MHRSQQIRQIPRLGKLRGRRQQNIGKAALLTVVAVAAVSQRSYSTTIPVLQGSGEAYTGRFPVHVRAGPARSRVFYQLSGSVERKPPDELPQKARKSGSAVFSALWGLFSGILRVANGRFLRAPRRFITQSSAIAVRNVLVLNWLIPNRYSLLATDYRLLGLRPRATP